MAKTLHREFVYLWYYFELQLGQIFPYWVLGMVLGSAVSVFLKERIHGTFRALGEKRLGILGIFAASMLGVASPLCMYGTIPIAASFSKSGIRDDWLAAFIQECVLEEITAEVMGLPEFDGRAFRAEVKEIQVQDNHSLVFVFYDGHRVARTWANPDRRYGRRSKSCQQ